MHIKNNLSCFDKFYLSVLFVLILAGFLLVLLPQLDIYFSNLFYAENKFWLTHHPFNELLHYYTYIVVILGLIFVFLYSLLQHLNKKLIFKNTAYYLLSILLGNLVVVNLVSKAVFGRARPRDILEFGGDLYFTPAIFISNQCHDNCSFVSGHASVGFLLFALAFIVDRPRWKNFFITLGLVSGVIIGLSRVMRGAHFISDIVFCAIIMLVVVWLLAVVMKYHKILFK